MVACCCIAMWKISTLTCYKKAKVLLLLSLEPYFVYKLIIVFVIFTFCMHKFVNGVKISLPQNLKLY